MNKFLKLSKIQSGSCSKNIVFFFCFFVSSIFFSCSLSGSLSLGSPSAQNWSPLEGKQLGIAEIRTIRVDKNSDWDSVEAETRRLLPLFLAEAGYKHAAPENVLPEQTVVIRVDVVLIEREYMENWKTKHSLSVEIFIWKGDDNYQEGKIPLAAGKALLSGKKSLSSSKTLHDLLKLALSNALQALPQK